MVPNRYGYPVFNYHHPMLANNGDLTGLNNYYGGGGGGDFSTRVPTASNNKDDPYEFGFGARSANEAVVGFKRVSGGQMNSKQKEVRNSYFNSSNAPTKSALFQELLECPICMNLYYNPLVLPCQHTFCKKCIVSLQDSADQSANSNSTNNSNNRSKDNNNKISCPICRESHNLTNGIDGLSANYTMKRLIELESMASEKEKMTNKANKEKAKCFLCQAFDYLNVCHDCSYMLCARCVEDPDHDLKIGKIIFLIIKNLWNIFFVNNIFLHI